MPPANPAATLRRALMGGPVAPADIAPLTALAQRTQLSVLAHATIPALAPTLAPAATRQRRLDAVLELALEHLANSLTRRGLTRVALLKGRAAAAWVYPETAQRVRQDIDLLVGAALPEIIPLLRSEGWADHVAPLRASEGPHRARAWPMVRLFGSTLVSLDLHRALIEPRTPWCHPHPDLLLDHARPGLAPLPITDPVDTALHTALHLVGNGLHGPFKGWVDLARLLPTLDPTLWATRAERYGLALTAQLISSITSRWFDLELPSIPNTHRFTPRHLLALRLLSRGDGLTPETFPRSVGISRRIWLTLMSTPFRPALAWYRAPPLSGPAPESSGAGPL